MLNTSASFIYPSHSVELVTTDIIIFVIWNKLKGATALSYLAVFHSDI